MKDRKDNLALTLLICVLSLGLIIGIGVVVIENRNAQKAEASRFEFTSEVIGFEKTIKKCENASRFYPLDCDVHKIVLLVDDQERKFGIGRFEYDELKHIQLGTFTVELDEIVAITYQE